MQRTGVDGFVQRRHDQLLLSDSPFRIAGANSYYFAFSTEAEQVALLDLASAFGFNVLRIWAFSEWQRAAPPGPDAVCFQFLPPDSATPQLVHSEAGLVRLDRGVKLAAERGIRLILTLTNYHSDYGGLPQYQRWFNLTDPLDMYRSPLARAAYRSYAESIITRVNTLTGMRYADDPAVLAWEIANEPRCPGDPAGCELLTLWLFEMSEHIRALAPRQLIAAGDEGLMNQAPLGPDWFHRDWLYNGSCGADAEDILRIPQIDLGTFHLYPTQWSKGDRAEAFGIEWIEQHLEAARRAGKPTLLEEFGLPASPERESIYRSWLEMIEMRHGAGDLVWMIGLPGKGDEYLLAEPQASPAVLEHAQRYASR